MLRPRPLRKGPQRVPGSVITPLKPPSTVFDPQGYNNAFQDTNVDSQYQNVRDDTPPNVINDVDVSRNWYSPLQPVPPMGYPYLNFPREWDYPSGYNINFLPERSEFFWMLRNLVQSWGLLATVIETRKDQLMRIPWAIQKRDKPDEPDPRIDALMAFFERPDRKNDWDSWVRLLLDDLFVIDAATIYTWKTVGGQPYAFQILDGATIKPLIDDEGRRPDAPQPAFQQIIKGLPMTNYDENELIYAPMRSHTWMPVYGYPPTEQIVTEIVQGVRRVQYQTAFWTQGTMPEMLATTPAAWTAQMIADFQAMFDGLMSGNQQTKSRIRFVPDGMKPYDIKNANGEGLKADIDEWLARIVCYAYSVPAQPFVRNMNRATAENAKQEAEEEGLFPLMKWFKSKIMDPLIRDPERGFGFQDLEFYWKPENETDPAVQATVISTYVKTGLMTPNEGREQLGLAPMDGGDELIVEGGQGPVPLKETVEANRQSALIKPQQDQARLDQLKNPPETAPGGQGPKNSGKGVGKASRAPFRQGYAFKRRPSSATEDHRASCGCAFCVAGRIRAAGQTGGEGDPQGGLQAR